MKRTFSLLLLAAVAAVAGPPTGHRIASFTLPDSTGKYYDILDYRGKVVIIEIMKTECPHCQALAQTLERMKARYGAKISVLSVVNPPDTPQTVAAFIAKYKVTSPILFDFGQATAAMLKVTPQNPSISLPHLLFVDANGIVRDDFAYSDDKKAIFEGDALTVVIDRTLAAK